MTVTEEMHAWALAQADAAALRDECRRLRVELDTVADVWRVREMLVERDRLRAELEQQKQLNLQLAERLAACSQVLGRAAERKGFDGVDIWSVVT